MSKKDKSKKENGVPDAGPYRAGRAEAETSENDGLVGDLVRQFADPYALFRELAQNAIDAGSSEIHVRIVITRADDAHEARLSVTDDGCGMTQQVLEEDLVVLFRSTKEDRGDTIGKFGIGFVSVLALAPSLVVVSTCVGDDVRHVLHLHPDRSYDLYREPGGTRGTTVTLHVPLKDDGAELVARSQAALERWCGHASVPIHFNVVPASEATPSVQQRIDRPIDLDQALVSVRAVSYDDETSALVGLVPETARLAAFYNRGLLLHASRDRGTRASIAFKVSDPRLSHTLSREDVRMDDAHARALRLVEHAISVPLTQEVLSEIGQAARAHVAGDATAGSRWIGIVDAARRAELAIDPRRIDVPLLAPVGGARVLPCLGGSGPSRMARERDALVDVLAAAGVPVIDASLARDAAEKETLESLLAAFTGTRPVHPRYLGSALVPLDAGRTSEADAHLLAQLTRLLGVVLRAPSSVHLVDVVGADTRLTFTLAHVDRAHLASARDDEADPFRIALRPPLGIAAGHPVVMAARAHPDPVVAADVLARAVLADRELVTEARSLALADASLRSLFGGGAR